MWFVIVLAVLGITAWFVWPVVKQWHHESMLTRARAFNSRGDLRSAVLTTKALLFDDPNNIGGAELMARMAEKAGSPAAVEWRAQVAQLAPTTENRIALANAALRFGNLALAELTLARIPMAERKSLDFIKAAASLALERNQRPQAEKLLTEIVRQEPDDPLNQLNLASLRLILARTNASVEIRKLELLATNPIVRLPALRTLIATSVRAGETNRAVQLAAELTRDSRATLADQLLHLQTLQAARHPDFRPKLARLQKAIALPDDVAILVSWMTANRLAPEAEVWINSLPVGLQNTQPVPAALAEALVAQEKWALLEKLTLDSPWQDKEFLRLALQARAMRARGDEVGARKPWKQAVSLVQGKSLQLATLARMAAAWHWEGESEDVWWRVANGGSDQVPALQSLLRYYTGRNEARGILRVCRRILELNPDDALAKNNVAMLSLLVQENVAEIYKLARENYQAHPQVPAFVSTYAFSLLLQKQPVEAEKIMQALPPEFLETPSAAAYYGLILVANKKPALAARYLDIANAATNLLSEERILVTEARRKLK